MKIHAFAGLAALALSACSTGGGDGAVADRAEESCRTYAVEHMQAVYGEVKVTPVSENLYSVDIAGRTEQCQVSEAGDVLSFGNPL
ncbi:hypothetical protein [Mangrovicoccus sp. HB161399]|uniref:hypothetical protein n=1 Tax=Mangrovicoccus sp. HB161399 TaxID=2720392 RepID=UPI0015580703|nr:hypothetical protein [Mangrovicoccus sp. HB161399]